MQINRAALLFARAIDFACAIQDLCKSGAKMTVNMWYDTIWNQTEVTLKTRWCISRGFTLGNFENIYIFFLSFIRIIFTLGHRSSHGHSWYPCWIDGDIKSEFYFIPFEKQQGELSIEESIEFISLWQNQEATAASCHSKLIKEDAKTGRCSTDHCGCCCSGSFILTGRHFYIKWKQNSTQSSWW